MDVLKYGLITVLLLSSKMSYSQNEGLGAAVGAIAAIGVGIAAVEQMKENAELTATEWLLSNHPEKESFMLKTIDFEGKKLKDMSSVSVISFKIQEFEPQDKPVLNGEKSILLGFTSKGWINEYGIDFNKVKWFLLDKKEWGNMMTSYVSVASGEKDKNLINETLKDGKIVNKGVKNKGKMAIPFYKMGGDYYVVTDYSEDMRFVYNERSLGIYLNETSDLVQIKRSSIIEIHDFFFED